ncbi:hypothetical protein CDD81_1330 [Ophiocordyceps australis]|uniref:Uncharacterized protein n=1 Tax=Ophiocordyceps australis TaxID=1399860 RepID=A0A2C5Y0H1_9HYPO|nr:hypothetical protein CDD81_1330 [Ophiocordyceps australis]
MCSGLVILLIMLAQEGPRSSASSYLERVVSWRRRPRPVSYRPQASAAPPVPDPFASLDSDQVPHVPAWNAPVADAYWHSYGLTRPPPLLVASDGNWPALLQTVVSYLTAGWPADQLVVVDNSGVARANAQARLTLSNPRFLNYGQLRRLGVSVVPAPVLMSFAQLQNFLLHLAHVNSWPYFFRSRADVVALSPEDASPRPGDAAYRSLYSRCLAHVNQTLAASHRWADGFMADGGHLVLVNRDAYDDVGGWDAFIPFHMSECDMASRLRMHKWSRADPPAPVGTVTRVSAVLADLRALYRDASVEPSIQRPSAKPKRNNNDALAYFNKLKRLVNTMALRGDAWQSKPGPQQGGAGEPFYYPFHGMLEAVDVLAEAGREVFRRKWGHQGCDLIRDTTLKLEDQWLVAHD